MAEHQEHPLSENASEKTASTPLRRAAERVQTFIKRMTHLQKTKGVEATLHTIANYAEAKPFDAEEFKQQVAKLEREFPGHVRLIDQGEALYHNSKDAESFVADNSFDISQVTVEGTGIYLTDKPTPTSNILVTLQRPIVCFDSQNDIEDSLRTLQPFMDDTHKGLVGAAKKVGFNGFVMQYGDSSSGFVPKGTNEVHIFDTDVAAITGGISHYPQKTEG